MKCLSKVKRNSGAKMDANYRLKKIESLLLETPKFLKKMEEIFPDKDFNRLTSSDVSKLMKLMPDKFEVLKNELVKEMEANL